MEGFTNLFDRSGKPNSYTVKVARMDELFRHWFVAVQNEVCTFCKTEGICTYTFLFHSRIRSKFPAESLPKH